MGGYFGGGYLAAGYLAPGYYGAAAVVVILDFGGTVVITGPFCLPGKAPTLVLGGLGSVSPVLGGLGQPASPPTAYRPLDFSGSTIGS